MRLLTEFLFTATVRMKIFPGSTVSQFRSVMSAPCTGRRVSTFTVTPGADRGFIALPGVPHDHKVKKMNNKEIVQRALKSLFEDYRGPASEFMLYFAPTFTMWANGNESDLAALLAHFARLEVTVPDRTVEFLDVLSEGDVVFTRHIVTILHASGQKEYVDVFARFKIASAALMN